MKAELLIHSQCFLGEGPFWYAERKLCLWVDIDNCCVFAYDWANAAVRSWNLDHKPSLIVKDHNGQLLLAMKGGIARINMEDGKLEWLVALESDQEDHRTNDGACDAEADLDPGTMHTAVWKVKDLYIVLATIWCH